jgi:alpha-tubulin suppressor-like RCC1 family protein
VLSECGKVFPFGRNNHGQLGIGNIIDSYLPQSIPTLRGLFVQKVLKWLWIHVFDFHSI